MSEASMDFDSGALRSALGLEVELMEREADVELDRLGERIAARARELCPVGPPREGRGRHLKDTISSDPGTEARGHYVDVGTRDPVGLYVEFGTRPHQIRVRTKKVLANVDTGEVFGKTVNHPGTTAQPFMRPAFAEEIARWDAL